MKKFIFITVTIALFASCADNQVTDEKFEPTDEELFEQCKELKGIGQFVIGQTTFKEALKDKDLNSLEFWDTNNRSNLYNGHWGTSFWHYLGEDSNKYHDKIKWMEKQCSGSIKQLNLWGSGGYKGLVIGGVKFKDFDMAFLDDVLIAIWFFPEESLYPVLNAYKEKYGNGRGSYYWYRYRSPGNNPSSIREILKDHRVWENERIALKYDAEMHSFITRSNHDYADDRTLIIYDKEKLPIFESQLKALSKEYNELETKKKEEALSIF